ncbi:MAG: LON peptidase substrate-binding domain-containing protein [Planctomycetota bacterium]
MIPEQDRPSELPEVIAAPILVPMFPLQDVYLFPGTFIPLHIFEPRYRQMVEDSLDGPGRIVIASPLEDGTGCFAATPAVHPIAGLGEIARHERLEDGRFMIWLAGLTRVRIVGELNTDRLYRKVFVQPVFEGQPSSAEEAPLRAKIVEAVMKRTPDILNIPGEVPLGHLVDLLLLKMSLPRSVMQDAYAQLHIGSRALCALHEHARRPLTDPNPPQDRGDQGASLN